MQSKIMPKVQIVKFQEGETLKIKSSNWFDVIQDIDIIAHSIQELGCVIHDWVGFPDGVEIPEEASKKQLLALASVS